jgi:hypothetical protein
VLRDLQLRLFILRRMRPSAVPVFDGAPPEIMRLVETPSSHPERPNKT